MSEDKLVKEHQEKLQTLRDEVKDRKQEILDNINIDEMMMNPKGYLGTLAKEFYESNSDKFDKAIMLGKELSKDMIKEIGNDTRKVQDAEIQIRQEEGSTISE